MIHIARYRAPNTSGRPREHLLACEQGRIVASIRGTALAAPQVLGLCLRLRRERAAAPLELRLLELLRVAPEQFLAADQAAAWLVYADWLEEHYEYDLAELIRRTLQAEA